MNLDDAVTILIIVFDNQLYNYIAFANFTLRQQLARKLGSRRRSQNF